MNIILPNTLDAEDWSAPNEGALVEYESLEICFWSFLDEDIEFVVRGEP